MAHRRRTFLRAGRMKIQIGAAVAATICAAIMWTVARADAATVWPMYEHNRSQEVTPDIRAPGAHPPSMSWRWC